MTTIRMTRPTAPPPPAGAPLPRRSPPPPRPRSPAPGATFPRNTARAAPSTRPRRRAAGAIRSPRRTAPAGTPPSRACSAPACRRRASGGRSCEAFGAYTASSVRVREPRLRNMIRIGTFTRPLKKRQQPATEDTENTETGRSDPQATCRKNPRSAPRGAERSLSGATLVSG